MAHEPAGNGDRVTSDGENTHGVHQRDQEEYTLAVRLSNGDANAFAIVFRRHYLNVVRFLKRYRWTVADAEDIAQDVFGRLWERRATLDPTRSIRAWLLTTARNQAINRAQHDTTVAAYQTKTVRELGDRAEHSPEPTPDDLVLAGELEELAVAQVATLSPRLREIYHLSRLEGLSPTEIAETLGVSINTVYVQYARMLRALHPTLERWLQE